MKKSDKNTADVNKLIESMSVKETKPKTNKPKKSSMQALTEIAKKSKLYKNSQSEKDKYRIKHDLYMRDLESLMKNM